MGKTARNGFALNHRSVGSGEDVILIHGLATNHAFWRFDVLMALAKNYRVTVYDLRGHGYSNMPDSGYTSLDMAEDLCRLMDHLKLESAHLVGHSFGGVVALHFAVLHPERTHTVTVADARVRSLQPHQRLSDWPDWKSMKCKFEENGIVIPDDMNDIGIYILEKAAEMRKDLKNQYLLQLFNGPGGGNHSAEKWLKLLRTTDARLAFANEAGLTEDRLTTVRHPVLLLYGGRSTLLQSMEGLKRCIPHSTSAIIPEAGHFFPLTRPRVFVSKVEEFLAANRIDAGHAADEKTACGKVSVDPQA